MVIRRLFDDKKLPVKLDSSLLPDLTRAIEANPGDFANYWKRAFIYDQLRKYQRAIADYTRVIAINPEFTGAYINRAAGYADLGKYNQAIIDLNQAIWLAPKAALAYHNRSYCYFRIGNIQAATQDIDKAISLDPRYPYSYFSRARLIIETRTGPLPQADPDANKALGLGRFDEALSDINKAIRLNPKDASIIFYRAKIYQEMGENQKAIADIAKAQKLGLPEDVELSAKQMLSDLQKPNGTTNSVPPDPI